MAVQVCIQEEYHYQGNYFLMCMLPLVQYTQYHTSNTETTTVDEDYQEVSEQNSDC